MTNYPQITAHCPALLEQEWRPIETAPKDGTRILVNFKPYGPLIVAWDDPTGCDEPYIWCLDDFKHGPYAVRGYIDGDDTHWRPVPIPPGQPADPTLQALEIALGALEEIKKETQWFHSTMRVSTKSANQAGDALAKIKKLGVAG